MTSIKTILVAGLLSITAAAPAFAQEAIQEPGLFSFYHPDLDVLNGGAPTPAYGLPPSVLYSLNEEESGFGGPVVVHRRVQRTAHAMHGGRHHG